jgi:hypothetical protein
MTATSRSGSEGAASRRSKSARPRARVGSGVHTDAMTGVPAATSGAELDPSAAATLLGLTEDDVLIRQGRGELPAVLRVEELLDETPAGTPDDDETLAELIVLHPR